MCLLLHATTSVPIWQFLEIGSTSVGSTLETHNMNGYFLSRIIIVSAGFQKSRMLHG